MSVPISVVKRLNPSKPEEEPRYYGMSQVADEVDFDSLCELASDGCTVTQADISAAFYAVVNAAIKSLKDGRIIRLGNLGSMQVAVNSKGAETKEEYNVSLIRRARIRFNPGKALKDALKVLTYRLVPQRSAAEKKEEGPKTDEHGNFDL